ncbi:Acetylcholine receptor subunit delta [Mizuhopecten yessoensis]|uniref:Acetylcholine receptor subunit delta n=1 Tax=Mizuhopecten yessoensis TaxID=6573 RepID=A0A210QI08_MIZYE|nr:Acetylcholine receptor subunit delta [Mizuhopecten yessoensis]
MTWAAKDFGYMFTTTLPQHIVWKPEILLVIPYDEVESLGFDQQTIRLIFNGGIYWSPIEVYQSVCPVDVTF